MSSVFQILIRNRATELDARMNDGTTPLILAARLAVEGMVEELIHCHADINAVDDHGQETTLVLFTPFVKYLPFVLDVCSALQPALYAAIWIPVKTLLILYL